jgi:ubiquinone/menaquinone biosynthesis C-methylase UbiE
MEAKTHWESVYASKAPAEVSWFQEHATVSLALIKRTGLTKSSPLIDVGGGASTLVDDLLAAGFDDLTVLDVSGAALAAAKARLGTQAVASVTWLEADVTQAPLPHHRFALWHDRAVFHFLTQEAQRQKYIEQVCHAVQPGGHVIVATFAPDGPLRCSGLEVMRYSPATLHATFGETFRLVEHTSETHHTPFGTEQQFVYCYCRRM